METKVSLPILIDLHGTIISFQSKVAKLFPIFSSTDFTKECITDHNIIAMPRIFQQVTTVYFNHNDVKCELDHLNLSSSPASNS